MTRPAYVLKEGQWVLEDLLGRQGPAGPPGGGAGTAFARINGLVKDYDPPGGIDNVSALVLDASAHDWLPGHEYLLGDTGARDAVPSFVHPVGDPSTVLKAILAANGTSGPTEPPWDTGGGLTDDGDFRWAPAQVFKGEWAPLTEYAEGDSIRAAGSLWACLGSPTGTSATDVPDWSSAPNFGDTVTDAGGFDWINNGPVSTWAPNTVYGIHITADGSALYEDFVLPSTDNGFVFAFDHRMARSARSGSVEPPWDPNTSHYTLDGEIIWVEATGETPALVMTGLAPPSTTHALLVAVLGRQGGATVTLEDQQEVESDYGVGAASQVGFDFGDENAILTTLALLIYDGAVWTDTKGLFP